MESKLNLAEFQFKITKSKFRNDYVQIINCIKNNKKIAYVKFHELKDSYKEYWNFISEKEFEESIFYRNYISLDVIWTDRNYRNLDIGRSMMKIFITYVEKKYPTIPVILLEIDSIDGSKSTKELRRFYNYFGFKTLKYGGFDGFQTVMIKPINGTKLIVPIVENDKQLQAGTKVKIVACTRGHEFEIGETVTLIEQIDESDSWLAENYMGESWSVAEHEFEIINDYEPIDRQQSLKERRKIDPYRK